MGQINVAYDDQLEAAVRRVASAKGLSHPELLRLIATEAVEAHDAGRLAFQTQAGPKLDSSLNALVGQLREAVVELDRVQRHNQAQEKKLRDAFVFSEENILAAKDELTRRVNDINSKSYQPFVQKVKDVRELVASLAPSIAATISDAVAGIDKRLGRIETLAVEPRHETKLALSEDSAWTLRFLMALAGLTVMVAILTFLLLASIVQPMAVSVSNRILDDQASVCRLVEKRYDTRACEVPIEDRVRYARIRKAELR